jgi:hypothetical protein
MKSALAAAVALSTATSLATPSLAAAQHHHTHAYGAPGYAYGRIDHPGILHPTPRQLGWGNECVVDNGQGRYFPCDAGGG